MCLDVHNISVLKTLPINICYAFKETGGTFIFFFSYSICLSVRCVCLHLLTIIFFFLLFDMLKRGHSIETYNIHLLPKSSILRTFPIHTYVLGLKRREPL
ncbi:hypothetical protein HanIR_Chr08g0379631 [Helianthus annuus]|nr:hypothetical protein HanIR_Chr08g0379631 [Helianthus annuus]